MCPAAVVIPHTCLANANLADTTYFTDVQVARSYAEDFAELVQTLETSISGIGTATRVGRSTVRIASTSSAGIKPHDMGSQSCDSGLSDPFVL